MENSLSVSFSPLSVLFAFAFQLWLVIFPIIIIRKLNYISDLLEANLTADQQDAQEG